VRVERVNERTYGRDGVRIEVMYWALSRTECGLGHTAQAARLNARRRRKGRSRR
jgi:hypothetical protein